MGPFHGCDVDRHRGEIRAKLNLQLEMEGVRSQFVLDGRPEHVRAAVEVELVMDGVFGVLGGISEEACSATSASRSLISTRAPCAASSSAVARPMPRAEP